MQPFSREEDIDLTYISRRFFVTGLAAAGALSGLAACGTGPGPEAALPEGAIPFSTSRDYSAEPFDVRVINRRRFDTAFAPVIVQSPYTERPGTIVINAADRQLFLIEENGMARRYGIAVGAAGYAWSGRATIQRKAAWPAWHPTPSMRAITPGLPRRFAPGADNPLGARALYLYQGGRDTLYRIHGTSEPWTIGTLASSGCIRMFNEDVIDLYDRVRMGASVVVLQ